VDTHGTLETRIVIGLQAFGHHLNRTLLTIYAFGKTLGSLEDIGLPIVSVGSVQIAKNETLAGFLGV
jgi:hypothetical protein